MPSTALTISGFATSPCTEAIVKNITFSGNSTLQHNCAGFRSLRSRRSADFGGVSGG